MQAPSIAPKFFVIFSSKHAFAYLQPHFWMLALEIMTKL